MMNKRFATIILGWAFTLTASATIVQEVTQPAGFNCLFAGHSYFIPVAEVFNKLPAQYGIENHRFKTVFRGGSSGSVNSMWNNPSSRKAIQKILDTGKIDLFALPYHSKTDSSKYEDFKRWVDYAIKCNPNISFFLAHRWESKGPTRALEEYERVSRKNSEDFYRTCEKLRKLYPKNTFFFVNYGLASIKLKGLFEAGKLHQVEGMVAKKKKTGVYQDTGGHASHLLKDLSALMWLKVLYDVDLSASQVKTKWSTIDIKKMAEDLLAEQIQRKQHPE